MSVFFWLLGTVFASFICCVASRLLNRQSLWGRSHCECCSHPLSPADLIPIFSFLFLKGRCRYCGAWIERGLFVSELLNGFLWAALYLRYGLSLLLLRYLTLFSILLAISICDLKSFTVPDSLLVILLIARVMFYQSTDRFELIFLQAAALPVFLLAFSLIFFLIRKKQPMGLGDIKLFYVLGCYFSWETMVLMLFLACLFGIIFCLFTGIKGRQRPFPFVPSIYLAAAVTLFFGQQIIAFYLFRLAKFP
ncbi:MAG: prepilin peptidase [Erysipelotrichaceae bacterium]|nr:prepilin peptidase [Erysipelotrichaceae bacterium]